MADSTFANIVGNTATQTATNRFITYNTLADLYAFRDIEEYSPYCSCEHLELTYRRTILINELKGYNGDVICLQEVDESSFRGDLTREINEQGFDGIYLKKSGKRGELTEGSALFYRKTKFKLIDQHGQSIVNVLETEPFCEDLRQWAYKNPAWKRYIEEQPHTIQIAILEWVEHPGKFIIVCNTHLLWDESCPYVRLVQVLTTVRLLEQFVQRYKDKEPRVIYCGDFNSRPEDHVIQYLLKNGPQSPPPEVIVKPSSQPDVQPKIGDDPTLEDLTKEGLSHKLRLGNACGVRPYTCFTGLCKSHLDYIFYDLDLLTVTKVIPQLSDSIVTRHTALPNVGIPSDHLPHICEFAFKSQ